jgi:MSHA biogenesis protein MshK
MAAAQVLNDPTRPPAGISADVPDDTTPGNQLQSVMISPTRRAAIINGVMVELGEKYGDAVLMRVAEDEIVLRSGGSRQVLKLHPAVDKTDAERAGPSAPPGRARGKRR